MGILTKKIYRDLRYSKGRSISIILIVAVATSLYGGLNLAYINIQDTFEQNEEETHIQSVRFILENYTDPDQINLNGIDSIKYWDYRLAEITSAQIAGAETVFTAAIFGVPGDREPQVNAFLLEEGNYFTSSTSQELLLSGTFMQANDLNIGDKLEFPAFGSEFTIAAKIFSPEYVYNVNPTSGLPDISGLAAGWITLEHAQIMFNRPNQINEVLVTFNNNILQNDDLLLQHVNLIKSILEGITPLVSYVLLQDEAEQKMKSTDIDALDEMARLFGLVVLLLSLFVIYDNISKLIASQRNYIGTMRALGGSKRTITLHYTKMGSILGFLGVFIGIPLGWGISSLMTVEYGHLLGIPKLSTGFKAEAFYEATILIFGMSIIISFLSSLNAASINPREAMSSAFVGVIFSSKPFLERLFSKIPGLNTPTATIPLRNLFRHKRKTIITIFTYSVSLLIIMAALGFTDSFSEAIDNNYENNEIYDLQIYLQPGSSLAPNELASQLSDITGIEKFEGFTFSLIEISKDEISKSISLYGYNPSSELRKINFADGDLSGLVLGINIAGNLKADMGDQVEIFGDTHTVYGISAEIISESAFLPIDQMQSMFNLGTNVTGFMLTIINGISEAQVKNQLLQSNLPISLIISTDEVQQSLATLIQGLMAIIGVLVFIGFLTVALFSFNTVVLDVMTRENEFVNIRSLGGGRRKVAKVIVLQTVIISLVGAIISIPIGFYVTDLLIGSMVGDLMVLPTVIKPQSYAFGILSAFIASFIGVLAAIRHVMRIDLVDAMRNRVSN